MTRKNGVVLIMHHRRGEPEFSSDHLCQRAGIDASKVRHLAKTFAGPPIPLNPFLPA